MATLSEKKKAFLRLYQSRVLNLKLSQWRQRNQNRAIAPARGRA
jgi:hypothetical protein